MTEENKSIQVNAQQLQATLNATVERFANKAYQYESEIASLTAQVFVANDEVARLQAVLDVLEQEQAQTTSAR